MAAQKEKGGKKQQAPALDARREMSKTKEQVEEEMKISLSIRIKPLDLDAMDSDELKGKAASLWDTIVTLETDKYDYEQRRLAQDYELKELKKDRRSSSETRPSRRVSTLRLSQANTHPRSACSPSMRDVPTPEPTATGRSCMRAAGKLSELRCSRPCGKTSTRTGARGPRPVCPSGSVSDQAKRLETQRPPRARRMRLPEAEMLAVMKSMTRKKKKRRRRRKRKRRRNKKSLTLCDAINPMNSWLIKTRLCIQWRRLDRLSSLHTGQMSSSIHFIHSALLGRCFHIYIPVRKVDKV